jgi:acetyltransferase
VLGHVLRENHRMLDLTERLGFVRAGGRAGNSDITVVKTLGPM